MCVQRGIEPPTIISESGRALASHHTVLVFDVLSKWAPASLPFSRWGWPFSPVRMLQGGTAYTLSPSAACVLCRRLSTCLRPKPAVVRLRLCARLTRPPSHTRRAPRPHKLREEEKREEEDELMERVASGVLEEAPLTDQWKQVRFGGARPRHMLSAGRRWALGEACRRAGRGHPLGLGLPSNPPHPRLLVPGRVHAHSPALD